MLNFFLIVFIYLFLADWVFAVAYGLSLVAASRGYSLLWCKDIIVNKRLQNAVLGYNLKNDGMISVHFKGKPFSITVLQVDAPTSNAEGAKVEQFY